MKYIINYHNNTVSECEVLSQHEDKDGVVFECLVYDENIEDHIEIQTLVVYESIEDAQRALDVLIRLEMASKKYAAQYDYACGYYD